MKVKILLWIVASVLPIGVIADALADNATADQTLESGQPQVIHLNNSTKLTLLGVTTGTLQMAPGFENLRTANRLYTPTKPPMLWIKAEPDPNPLYEIVISDKSNTACVSIEKSTGSYVGTGVGIQGFILNAFPRWDKEFIVRVRPWPYDGKIANGQFVVSNPVPVVDVTNWVAESLPATKSDGDLEVTLNKFVTGAPAPYPQGKHLPADDPANQCVHLNFNFRQNGGPATNWNAWPVETFDAFGNHASGLIYAYPTNGLLPAFDRLHPHSYSPPPRDGYFYRPGLWPDQSPWKVRLEFSRTSGFSADEVWCVTNIPVQPGTQQDVDADWVAGMSTTNFVIAETTIAGIHLKLFRGLQYSDRDGRKRITVLVKADPIPRTKGIKLTVLKATDEQNRELDFFWGGTTVNYPFEPTWVQDAKSLNLTIATQKLRFVEFTVKPTKQ